MPPKDPVPEVKSIIEGLKRIKTDPVIGCTARVDLHTVPGAPFVGTAWIIEKKNPTKAIMVTNVRRQHL